MQDAIPTEVLIAGDVLPIAVAEGELARRLRIGSPPALFLWTLDAALPAGLPRPGYTCLPFQPEALDGLRLGQTTVAVTASNHITDFGAEGVSASLDELTHRGFLHVGAGSNRDSASRNLVIDLPAGRVAILAFAETDPRVSGIAAERSGAGIRRLDSQSCLEAIDSAAREADWVWVVLHWGEEYIRFPDPAQRRLALRMADAGASLVVASHVHVPLGYERHAESMIFYGLGNFMFPPFRESAGYGFRWPPKSREGVVVAGRYDAGRWTWEPREIRLSAEGLPSLGSHGHCPDYGRILPKAADAYERLYPRLRRRERIHYLAQRLLWMSWDERVARLKRWMGLGDSGAPLANRGT